MHSAKHAISKRALLSIVFFVFLLFCFLQILFQNLPRARKYLKQSQISHSCTLFAILTRPASQKVWACVVSLTYRSKQTVLHACLTVNSIPWKDLSVRWYHCDNIGIWRLFNNVLSKQMKTCFVLLNQTNVLIWNFQTWSLSYFRPGRKAILTSIQFVHV